MLNTSDTTGELNPGISGLEKCPGSRDFGIPGSRD